MCNISPHHIQLILESFEENTMPSNNSFHACVTDPQLQGVGYTKNGKLYVFTFPCIIHVCEILSD